MTTAEPPSPGPDDTRLSFKDREMLVALRRLANARSQVEALEEQLASQVERPWDPEDVERARGYQAEIERLAQKAQSRFGAAAARERLAEIEMQQRLVLDRLGVDSFDELRARGNRLQPVDAVDPAFVHFARRELAAAEDAYRQILAMPDEPPVDPVAADVPDERRVAHIDLTRNEAS